VIVHPGFVEWVAQKKGSSPKTLEYYEEIATAWKDRLVYSDPEIRVYATGLGK
jgi:hypothetical protein